MKNVTEESFPSKKSPQPNRAPVRLRAARSVPRARYFSILLKTSDTDSEAWHRLTDPLIDHYKRHLETPEASVLEIREGSGLSWREYSLYLIDFINAAHDGLIDLKREDPLSFEEWSDSGAG